MSAKLRRMYARHWARKQAEQNNESRRQLLIKLLAANDRNGIYTDADCDLEGMARLTLRDAERQVKEQGL